MLDHEISRISVQQARGDNLGARLREQFEFDLERGDAHWDDLQRARDLLDDALSANLPYVTVPAGRELGDIAIAVRMWPQGEHALRLALAAAGDLTGLRPLRPDKQRARSGVQGIGALAALCAARAGDAAMAALHLEQASATLLAEALGVRADTITSADITTACRAMGRSVPSPLRHRRTDPLTAECPACWSGPTPGRMTGPSPASRRGAPGRRPVPGGTDPAARPAVSRTGPVARYGSECEPRG